MPRLTEQEQQEIIRYLEADKPLPDKYWFLLFEPNRGSKPGVKPGVKSALGSSFTGTSPTKQSPAGENQSGR